MAGSMASDALVNLLHYFAIFKEADPCIFIFDGTTSHLYYSTFEAAERYDVTLLPSNQY
jgi:hypothetical protein